jgi:hypothetical protein
MPQDQRRDKYYKTRGSDEIACLEATWEGYTITIILNGYILVSTSQCLKVGISIPTPTGFALHMQRTHLSAVSADGKLPAWTVTMHMYSWGISVIVQKQALMNLCRTQM